jgi:hypothetical protein
MTGIPFVGRSPVNHQLACLIRVLAEPLKDWVQAGGTREQLSQMIQEAMNRDDNSEENYCNNLVTKPEETKQVEEKKKSSLPQ